MMRTMMVMMVMNKSWGIGLDNDQVKGESFYLEQRTIRQRSSVYPNKVKVGGKESAQPRLALKFENFSRLPNLFSISPNHPIYIMPRSL